MHSNKKPQEIVCFPVLLKQPPLLCIIVAPLPRKRQNKIYSPYTTESLAIQVSRGTQILKKKATSHMHFARVRRVAIGNLVLPRKPLVCWTAGGGGDTSH